MLCGLLFYLAHVPQQAGFTPLRSLQCALVHAFKVSRLHHQFDVLLLGGVSAVNVCARVGKTLI